MSEFTLQAVIDRFAAADCSWLSTVRPGSRPHATPIWHVWWNGRVYVVTTPEAVKVANINQNPAVVLTHPDPHRAIIIDGEARVVEGMAEVLRPFFKEKYGWDIVTDKDYTTIIEIAPQKILAWGDEGAGKRKRWRGDFAAGGSNL